MSWLPFGFSCWDDDPQHRHRPTNTHNAISVSSGLIAHLLLHHSGQTSAQSRRPHTPIESWLFGSLKAAHAPCSRPFLEDCRLNMMCIRSKAGVFYTRNDLFDRGSYCRTETWQYTRVLTERCHQSDLMMILTIETMTCEEKCFPNIRLHMCMSWSQSMPPWRFPPRLIWSRKGPSQARMEFPRSYFCSAFRAAHAMQGRSFLFENPSASCTV
jgi:hypothetical protein